MRSKRAVQITSAPGTGTAPPLSPVPEPRGTTGIACAAAKRSSAETSSVDCGKTIASGSQESPAVAS